MTDGEDTRSVPDDIDRRIDETFRDDAEEAEYDADRLRLRDRSLADVAFDVMSRGDLLRVGTVGHNFAGTVVYVHGDLVSLAADELEVDVNLTGPVHLEILRPAHTDGVGHGRGTGSFRARLSEIESTSEIVEIIAPEVGANVLGRIEAVAEDHVMIVDPDAGHWFVPTQRIAAVIRHR